MNGDQVVVPESPEPAVNDGPNTAGAGTPVNGSLASRII